MRVIALVLTFVCIAECVGAETLSDTELRAGYCLGVANEQIQDSTRIVREAKDVEVQKLNVFAVNIATERRNRFLDYLKSKGFGTDRNPESLKVANDRGRQDVRMCDAELEGPYYKRCGDQCAKIARTGNDLLSCVARCPSPETCDRVKKCLENFLPF
jgi:hypothetical protein